MEILFYKEFFIVWIQQILRKYHLENINYRIFIIKLNRSQLKKFNLFFIGYKYG